MATQAKKAEAIGITEGLYSKILSGAAPVSEKTARRIGSFIGLDWRAVLFLLPNEIDGRLDKAIKQNGGDYVGDNS